MSESFIRNIRLAGFVIFIAGIFMSNTLVLLIGQIGLMISLFIPYFRLEKLYFAMMNKPDLKEKIETLLKEDLEKRLGVNEETNPDDTDNIFKSMGDKNDETNDGTKEE